LSSVSAWIKALILSEEAVFSTAWGLDMLREAKVRVQ
jgi:hypothetical protein